MQELWLYFLEILRWLQSLLTVADLTYLIALLGFLAAAAPFYKKAAEFMYKHTLEPIGKFFSTFATLPDRLSSLEQKINGHEEVKKRLIKLEEVNVEIKKELTPNGGSSMKDVITKLAETMVRVEGSMTAMTEQASRMEARQQSLLNSVDIPVFETDLSGKCTFANKSYLKLIGRTFDEVKGNGWINSIHPDDRVRVREQWDSAIHDMRSVELTYRVMGGDKSVYEVFCEASPIEGAANGYSGHFETIKRIGTLPINSIFGS
jgi:PAS domain S-box-containing protein